MTGQVEERPTTRCWCAGLRALLDAKDDIEVEAEAGRRCGAAAVRLGRQVKPDVVLMDIRMPGTDGLTATREILASPELATVRVVMLTTFDLDEYVFEAIRSGAAGFLVKNAEPTELVRAVRVAAEGDALLSLGVTRRLIERFGTLCSPTDGSAQRSAGQTNVQVPTEREREVVTLVAQDLSNDQIAVRLSVSPLTAKTHVSRAMIKLGARDRAGLVVFAYETGLVKPGISG